MLFVDAAFHVFTGVFDVTMFLDDQSYAQFCGLSTFDDKMFYKQTAFNKTCNWNARRAVKPDIKRRTSR